MRRCCAVDIGQRLEGDEVVEVLGAITEMCWAPGHLNVRNPKGALIKIGLPNTGHSPTTSYGPKRALAAKNHCCAVFRLKH